MYTPKGWCSVVGMLVLLIVALLPISTSAQNSNLGDWLIYFGNSQMNDRINLHYELQHRNYNVIGDLEQLLLRTGVGYNLTENNNNLLLGYGYIHSQNYLDGLDEKQQVNEHRIFQQFITRQSFGAFRMQHRYRFEQRFIETDFRLRFRYFLSANLLLNSKQMRDGSVYLSAYNEIFVNDRGVLFDRNRLYGGLGYRISGMIRMELGYMNQFLGGGRNRDQVNIVTFLNI